MAHYDAPEHPLSAPAPSTPLLRSTVIHVPPYSVCVSIHDGQLLRGTFVAFDRVMNHVLLDCVELHPQEGSHASGLLVLPTAAIVSMTIEVLSSPHP
jgi:small nuclear ribonucleoprotein (snRNP)-like protein